MEAVTEEKPKRRRRTKKEMELQLTPEELELIQARRNQGEEDAKVDEQAEARNKKLAELDQMLDEISKEFQAFDKYLIVVPVQRRHHEWLTRLSALQGIPQERAIERIIRQAYAADSTKGGIHTSAASVKAADFKP